jgi:hypothetical protein
MSDGYEQLTKTAAWGHLQKAKDAAAQLQQCLTADGIRGAAALTELARGALADVENSMRRHFKERHKGKL